MRTYDNGSGYTVAYTESDAAYFSAQWPSSTVSGKGSFSYENNGDLIDATGTAAENDGSDWLAFSEDCQKYGESRIGIIRRKPQRAKGV